MPHTTERSKRYPVRLYLLGPLRVQVPPGGSAARPLALPTRKIESLLAYLALSPGPIAREQLAALFWGDSPDAQARNSLRHALAELRKHLGEPLLIVDRRTVQIAPEVWVDARELKTQADEFLAGASPHTEIDAELYQGDLLAGFHDEWILPERAKYRQLYVEILLRLTQSARSQSDYASAIAWAQRALRTDPTNERAHQHLMFAYVAAGDRSAALAQYETCRRVLDTERHVAPAPATRALYEWIRQAPPEGSSPQKRLTNMPLPLNSFVGRQRETAEVKAALATHRLVTLTGAGGSGKTRLALQAAADVMDRYAGGVWWVELASLRDDSLVPQVVAKALGVREAANEPVSDTLVYWIGRREMLLVLDNCEHLVTACARLVERLLQACPGLVILATSRERLALDAEVVWLVPPLSLPGPSDAPEALHDSEAIRLFVERARVLSPGFALNEKNAPAIAQICRRLDGIPLAIELAAARVRALSVQEIVVRLQNRFALLTTGSRTALPRQQTLRALIDWSYDLLSTEEKIVFRRSAVFHGGRPAAIERVCSGDGVPPERVAEVLTHLRDKSLLTAEERDGTLAYNMLDTVRDYAEEKLQQAGEDESIRRRHLGYFIELAETAEPKLRGAEQLPWIHHLEAEHNNLRAALEWSQVQGGTEGGRATLRLASSLSRFWALRGYWSEARAWLMQALESDAPSSARARALVGLAELVTLQDGWGAAEPLYEASLALFRAQGDKWGIALASSYCQVAQSDPALALPMFDEGLTLCQELGDEWLLASLFHRRGIHVYRQGDVAAARALIEQSLAHARQAGDRWLLGSCLVNLGEILRGQLDYEHALALYEEGLAIERELGDKEGSAVSLHNMGYVALYQHEYARAAAFFQESMNLQQELGRRRGIAECLMGLGAVAAAREQYERAARLWGGADGLFNAIRQTMDPADRVEYERHVAAMRGHMDETAFSAAWQAGHALTLEQAIALAVNDP